MRQEGQGRCRAGLITNAEFCYQRVWAIAGTMWPQLGLRMSSPLLQSYFEVPLADVLERAVLRGYQ